MSKTIVAASDVRAWAAARGLTVGARGPLPQEIIDAFNKAHRTKMYAAS